MLDLDYDIESDLHKLHGIWIDISEDQYGEMPAERLFSLIERLPAYDGATAARIHAILEEAKKHNPSAAALARPDTVEMDGTAAALNDPTLAGWVETVQV